MKAYDPQRPLVSLHIPKTGGTSLQHILAEWFPGERLIRHDDEHPVPHRFEGPICIHGHFNAGRGAGVDAHYPLADQFITFLRDPFDRFLSQWYFLNAQYHRGVRSPGTAPLNDQPDFPTWIDRMAKRQAEGTNSHSLVWQFPASPDVAAIIHAMQTRFVHVGIMERFDESTRTLAYALGKTRPQSIHVNQTERGADDLESWRAFHRKHFRGEYDIYDAALALNFELSAGAPDPA